MENKRKQQTEKLVLGAIFTALVIILQFMGSFIKFGVFSISLVLVPIVLGAALCGKEIGAWLGFVFGAIVLWSGDAAPFMAIDAVGTVATVMLKGTACGFAAGSVYKALEKYNRYVAVIAAAIICPIVNTGIFLLGCLIFFFAAITEWGELAGFNNPVVYMFLGLAGVNFLLELVTNVILSPVIVRVLSVIKKK